MKKNKKINAPSKIEVEDVLYRFYEIVIYDDNGYSRTLTDDDEIEFFHTGKYNDLDRWNDHFSDYEVSCSDVAIYWRDDPTEIQLTKDLLNIFNLVCLNNPHHKEIWFTFMENDRDGYVSCPAIVGIRNETDKEYNARLEQLRQEEERKEKSKQKRKENALKRKEEQLKELAKELGKTIS